MRILKWTAMFLTLSLFIIGLSGTALAKDDVGTMVALRGKAVIDRDKKELEAKLRDGILFNDTVLTLEASRAKMLFIDDSILTLGEKSRAVIREYVYSKEKGGRSIINLIDGKMRAIVGKANFEVHTPTAVAAARGTLILCETGVKDGNKFTTIICLEGEVSVSIPGVAGTVTLKPGMMITIFEGMTLLPDPVDAPAAETDRLLRDTDIGYEVSIPGPAEIVVGPGWMAIEPTPVILPPIDQQPSVTTTPVTIDLRFP